MSTRDSVRMCSTAQSHLERKAVRRAAGRWLIESYKGKVFSTPNQADSEPHRELRHDEVA
eukprot:gene8847-8020_t